jgi:hypothetical protein
MGKATVDFEKILQNFKINNLTNLNSNLPSFQRLGYLHAGDSRE